MYYFIQSQLKTHYYDINILYYSTFRRNIYSLLLVEMYKFIDTTDLHIVKQRGNNLVHVLRFPDVLHQVIRHSLSDHSLELKVQIRS